MQGNSLPLYIEKRYGKSKQMRFVNGQPIIPIGYIQTKAPLFKRRNINQFTPDGRSQIHKNLETVNIDILHYLMRNPVKYASVEFNSNRLSLYCVQQGKCAITKQLLEIGDIHCHHKQPKKNGGSDKYSNLVIVSQAVHILIHATDIDTIRQYLNNLKLDIKQKQKVNTLRKIAGLFSI